MRVRWSIVGAWVAWWAVVTAAFWLLGKVIDDQPMGLAGSAVFAALAVVFGDFGGRLRRRRNSRRAQMRAQADE